MIKIICVGKIKENYLKEAINDYLKRLSKYTKIEIIEIEEQNNKTSEISLLKEKEIINKHLSDKDYIVCLDIDGKQVSSIELAKNLEKWLVDKPNIIFIIGSSNGLHKDLKKQCHFRLSFSKLTFPHQLFRLILLEQIYRAFKINKNETYHK
ncbi:MAG: 23S rRNA (pseudouridine(1915)-N(3))-methyltransferase RlmH [Mollicutes bacterium]|nr:23S rRNA (pseudouridine(1915)-N(3))-methyltransferase RlmH [Mollicutes bacterium]